MVKAKLMRGVLRVGLSSALLLGCGGSSSETLKTTEVLNVGEIGTTTIFSDEFSQSIEGDIRAGIDALRAAGGCAINLTVHDLNNYPELEYLPNGQRAAGRGFPGGDLYIAGDILPEEQIDIANLSAHEGSHACVSVQSRISPFELSTSQTTGSYVSGFAISASYAPNESDAIGALDEAVVELYADSVIPSASESTYDGVTQMLSETISEGELETLNELRLQSNLPDAINLLTNGETPTTKSTGCVIVAFSKVIEGYSTPEEGIKELAAC